MNYMDIDRDELLQLLTKKPKERDIDGYLLGLELGLSEDALESIQKKCKYHKNRWLVEVVDAWINEDTGTPLDLACALRDIGKRALAEVVAEKYKVCNEDGSPVDLTPKNKNAAKISEIDKNIEEVNKGIKEAREMLDKLSGDKNEMERMIEEKNLNVMEFDRKIDENTESIEKVRLIRNLIRKQSGKKNLEAGLNDEIESLTQENETTTKEIQLLKSSIEELENKLEQMEEEKVEKEKELEELQKRKEELEKEYEDVSEKLKEAEKLLYESKKKEEELNEGIQIARKKMRKMKQELREKRKIVAELETKIKEQKTKMVNLKTQLKERLKTVAADDYEQIIEEYRVIRDSINEEIGQIKSDIDNITKPKERTFIDSSRRRNLGCTHQERLCDDCVDAIYKKQNVWHHFFHTYQGQQ